MEHWSRERKWKAIGRGGTRRGVDRARNRDGGKDRQQRIDTDRGTLRHWQGEGWQGRRTHKNREAVTMEE